MFSFQQDKGSVILLHQCVLLQTFKFCHHLSLINPYKYCVLFIGHKQTVKSQIRPDQDFLFFIYIHLLMRV